VAWIEEILGRRRGKRRDQPLSRDSGVSNPGGTVPTFKTLAEQMMTLPTAPVGSQLPRFKSTAADQLNRGAQTAFDEMRSRLYTGFAASQPVADRRSFAGRSEVLERLIRATEDLRLHVVLYGERGLGKTSCLHMLAHVAREAGYLVVYISCGTKSAFEEVIRCAAAQVPLLYCRGVAPASAEVEAGKTFADILPADPFSPQAASEVLASIVDTRVLVILDEFDQSLSRDFRVSVAELLKNLSDRAARIQFLIAGIADNLTELIEHVPSIQRNIFALQLERMSPSELRDVIRNGEAITGLRFDQEAAGQIIDVANGFPYFARLLASYAGLRALDDQRSTANIWDVLGAIHDAAEQFGGRIPQKSKKQLERLAETGHLQHLGALAGAAQMKGGAFATADFETLFPDEERVAECRRLVENLTATNGVIARNDEREAGTFRFLDDTAVPYVWFCAALEKLRRETAGRIRAGTLGGGGTDNSR